MVSQFPSAAIKGTYKMTYEKGSFVIVPNKTVLKGKKPAVQVVFMWLCFHADEHGRCFPSIKTLARECGLGITSVKSALDELVDKVGIVKRTTRKVGVENLSNRYQIMIAATKDFGDFEGTKGSDTAYPPRNTADPLPVIRPVTISNITISNNTSADSAAHEVFSLSEEIRKLEDSARRELNVIALFMAEKHPDLRSRAQFSQAIKRHIRPAKALVPFSDNQILDAVPKARRLTSEWTLETLIKVLTK